MNNLMMAAAEAEAAARFTFHRGGVDVEPRPLHQELADVEVPIGRGEVEQGPPLGSLHSTQVQHAHHF